MDVVDFRSDFIARPTAAMVDAMTRAAREQPGFGLRDDASVARLEARAAELLGTEDALFCPTCTLANQIAIHLHCRPGESVLAEPMSHVFSSEAGSPAALSGALAVHVPGRGGAMDLAELAKAIRAGDASRSRSALVVIENTHVFSGGRVVPLATMEAIGEIARRHKLAVHIDGARLFNAAAALALPAQRLVRGVDSVAVSLNKALAAPMGAILAGRSDFIREAVRVRQMFGGGWRPANIVAAAAMVALDTMIERIAEDHRQARRLAEGLAACRGIAIDPDQVQSNIVLAQVDERVMPVGALLAALQARGILVSPITVGAANVLRFVTHHETGAGDIDRALAAVQAAMTRG